MGVIVNKRHYGKQMGAKVKRCRKCDVVLISGKNWRKSRPRDYVCKNCAWRCEGRVFCRRCGAALGNDERRICNHCYSHCAKCGVELTDENQYKSQVKRREYICRNCFYQVATERNLKNKHGELMVLKRPEDLIPTCYSCQETNEAVLEHEHVTNNGEEERNKYRAIIRHRVIKYGGLPSGAGLRREIANGNVKVSPDTDIILCASCHMKREREKKTARLKEKWADPTVTKQKKKVSIEDKNQWLRIRKKLYTLLARGGPIISVDGETDIEKLTIGHALEGGHA